MVNQDERMQLATLDLHNPDRARFLISLIQGCVHRSQQNLHSNQGTDVLCQESGSVQK